MGWLWSTAGSKPKGPDAPSQSTAIVTNAAAASPSSTAPPPPSSSPTSTADDYDDPELRTFVAMLQATPLSPGKESPAPAPTAAAAPASPDDKDTNPPLRERSLGDAVLPTSMSCRQAFDLAWACQSPAGQWRAVYRHGSVQPCSRLWDDFWFCMRVRGGGDNESDGRAHAVREHYRTREVERYYGPGQPSSEDVWRSRTVDEVLPPGAVFQHGFHVAGDARNSSNPQEEAATGDSSNSNPDAGSRKDADQILADMERRRQIRQQIGYKS